MAFIQGWSDLPTASTITAANVAVSGATVGNRLVGIVSVRDNAAGTLTDIPTPTGWALVEKQLLVSFGYAKFERTASGDASDVLATTWGTASYAAAGVAEYSGLDAAVTENSASTTLTGTSIAPGSATPTSANGVSIAGLGIRRNQDWSSDLVGAGVSIDSSYTIDAIYSSGSSGRPMVVFASKEYTTTGAQAPTWSTTELGGVCGASVSVFKAAASGDVKFDLKIGGVWRKGTPYIRDAGAWKKVVPYTRSGGVWKTGPGLAPVVPVPPGPTPDPLNLIYVSDFETGAVQSQGSNPDGWAIQAFVPGHQSEQISVVTSQARHGTRSLRAYYDPSWGNDPNGKMRSEVRKQTSFFQNGQTYMFGFSTFIANNANNIAVIADDSYNNSLVQWHLTNSRSSQIHLRSNKYNLHFGTLSAQDVGDIRLGVWDDWVFHVKCSTGGDGFCYVWLNADSDAETPVYIRLGANLDGSLANPDLDFKLGIYRNIAESLGFAYVEQFYDAIRVAQSINSPVKFEDVSPRSFGAAATPREDVIFFSGGELGPTWPGNSATEDGWRLLHYTTNIGDALRMDTAATFGITAKAGTNVLRTRYDYPAWGYDDFGRVRSEIGSPGNITLADGDDVWIGFSTFLKNNTNNQNIIQASGSNQSLFQMHNIAPVSGANHIHIKNGNYLIGLGSGSSDGGAVQLGQWEDWVVHIKVSSGVDGLVEVWKNAASSAETPIYTSSGANAGNTGKDMKWGVYRGDFESQPAAVWNGATYAEQFYDEIRVARGANANFNSVKPGS